MMRGPAEAAGSRRRLGAPIALQILALLVGGLVIAQIATVLVVLVLPPEPPRVYRMSEVAAVLEGAALIPRDAAPLIRTVYDTPPGIAGRADRSGRRDLRVLAAMLGVPEDHVRLERHRPPPFAGAEPGRFNRSQTRRPDSPLNATTPGGAVAQGGLGPETTVSRAARLAVETGRPLIGSFTAALRQPSGSWVVVRPPPEPFLNDWQRRVLFWFVVSLGLLGPLSYLFARRITAPLREFARAAERIGRDPTAKLVPLSGPAEIGIAARAMNDMQVRLKRYVQDRTATIAAVSHDLRTPLARMRFKLEKAPEPLKESLTHDVEQMEQMVRAVLEFIREGSEPRRRERLDLLSAVECVVDDAAAAGRLVELADGEPVIVEADPLGLERLFANLVDNAAKYGREARVSVWAEGEEGVVEIADQGPGLPETELERVFQPFYRVEPSRSRDTGGIGLGLAVARSIARAHGGEVSLSSGELGLVAQVRLPRVPS